MRALSTGSQSPTSPDHVSELPPSLGKLNSWLEENRRRSRMTASGSGVGMGEREIDTEPEEGRRRADSGTLGTPILGGPASGSRPMSLASLKDVYRRSATLDKSIIGSIKEREALPGTPAK